MTLLRDLIEIPESVGDADFVVLTVPLTPETRGMIGERELRAMRSSAWLMNVTGAHVSASDFPGAESPGQTITLDAGVPYAVSESGPSGYAESDSADCSGTLAPGQHKPCTNTNDCEAARKISSRLGSFGTASGATTGVAVMPTSGVMSVVPTSPLGTEVTPGPRKLVCHRAEAFAPALLSASKA